jgi:hypothetical protein
MAAISHKQTLGICVGALWVAGCVWAPPAGAEFVPRIYEARRVDVAPVLDGHLDDRAWQRAQRISEFYAYQTGQAPASQTTGRLLWDDQFLYLGLEMSDADIRPSSLTSGSSGRDGRLYEGDVIEFFTRPDNMTPQYFEFEFSPNGDLFDARFDAQRFGPPGPSWNTDLSAALHVEGTWDDPSDRDQGWIVEARIPTSAFPAVQPGTEWRVALARYDYFVPGLSAAQLMMSTPGDPDLPNAGLSSGFHTYEMYDRLVFTVPEPHQFAPTALLLVPCCRRGRRLATFQSGG